MYPQQLHIKITRDTYQLYNFHLYITNYQPPSAPHELIILTPFPGERIINYYWKWINLYTYHLCYHAILNNTLIGNIKSLYLSTYIGTQTFYMSIKCTYLILLISYNLLIIVNNCSLLMWFSGGNQIISYKFVILT